MKIWSSLIFMLLGFSVTVFAGGLNTQTEATPKVFQVTPKGVATLPASRWMQFSDCRSEAACCNKLSSLALTYKNGPPQFEAVPGLTIDVPVEQAYRTQGSILITWTLRIEGQDAEIINPWRSGLCNNQFAGTVMETFEGGEVHSQAYIDLGSGFKAMGEAAKMTIPDGGGQVVTYTPPPPPPPRRNTQDPTHSGNCLLKASDFPGGFPATVRIKIYWKNDSSMIITSSDAYRSLIVSVLPTKK